KLGKGALILIIALAVAAYWLMSTDTGRQTQFLIGGAFVNLGYRMQDHLEVYDFDDHHDVSPEEIWDIVRHHNSLASSVRDWFPRTSRHPLVALVACMDQRIDTAELTGDTRMYYYVIRTAGSILSEREQEMLELAVANGVKLILLTTHTDCAAEGAAASPESRALYPAMTQGVDNRENRFREFLERPVIAKRVANGELLIKEVLVDSKTRKMKPLSYTPSSRSGT
ncbi:MAG: hypothetical protein KDD70_17760, partial [Bdellovibrionales bacterium]|nr:hypothetical protein [Bdellovibrionales bacterium]